MRRFLRVMPYVAFSALALTTFLFLGQSAAFQESTPGQQRIETQYGTPTAVEAEHEGYVRGHAGHATEWVAEYLDVNVLQGTAKRDGIPFSADMDQPKEWRVENDDYRDADSQGIKYDRGHQACAADNHRSRKAMVGTFRFTNMMPQTSALNRSRKKWAGLEAHVRDEAIQPGSRVWVFTGPAFLPDDHGDIIIRTIGKHAVWVPTHCWKTMLVERNGQRQAFAWLMENTKSPRDWQECQVSVDALEAALGFDFWRELSDDEEDKLESATPLENSRE